MPNTLPTSIGAPADVRLYWMPDMQTSLNTPVMDMQGPHQTTAPRTVTATTAQQQGTARTPVAQMIPHTQPDSRSVQEVGSRDNFSHLAGITKGLARCQLFLRAKPQQFCHWTPVLSFRTAPYHQMENRKPATQPPSTPQTTSACMYGSDPDQQHVAASSSAQCAH